MQDHSVSTRQVGEPLADAPDKRAGLAPPRRRRRWLEPIAMGIMALGFVMMFQPLAKILFSYSFIVILFGTLMFIVVSHLPE